MNKIHCADSLEFMKSIPSGVIDMCLTSPPYWGLRDYGIEQIFGGDKNCDHEWGERKKTLTHKSGETNPGKEAWFKNKGASDDKGNCFCLKCYAWKGQLGLEPTPELYIEHMTEIFNEVKRVLKKEGTFWLNIGDTYWSAKGSCFNPGGNESALEAHKKEMGAYPLYRGNKSDVPNLPPKCLAMIPERLSWSLIQNGWILRNKIPWIKPNSMPSSVKDRFSNTYEFVYMFSKSQRYYFDLDSAREPHQAMDVALGTKGTFHAHDEDMIHGQRIKYKGKETYNPLGKNPGDIWIIPTVPCPIKGIHFATFPEELCKKAIIPGCPKGGIVLDPFCGVGTACYVARKLGRKYIGIDIKAEYCEKAENIRLAQGVL